MYAARGRRRRPTADEPARRGAAEEEKLAYDLYTAFARRYDTRVFDQIARAEANHLAMVGTLLGRYKVPDPTVGKAAGQFASADVKAAYDRLLAQGSANEKAALQTGVTVEKDRIAHCRRPPRISRRSTSTRSTTG